MHARSSGHCAEDGRPLDAEQTITFTFYFFPFISTPVLFFFFFARLELSHLNLHSAIGFYYTPRHAGRTRGLYRLTLQQILHTVRS